MTRIMNTSLALLMVTSIGFGVYCLNSTSSYANFNLFCVIGCQNTGETARNLCVYDEDAPWKYDACTDDADGRQRYCESSCWANASCL